MHGRPVLNAVQQQGFEALRQGLAPSANQQAALHSLWGEAPGYVPVQQGGWDEFLSAPAADAADGFRSGPLALGTAQDACEAAQRQAFLKWTQGEAMTAQEKALVDGLWNTDPAKASEYWAAGEFLDTEAPGASSLDGGGLDGTMNNTPLNIHGYNTTIHHGRQNKHIIGSNNYKLGRSVFYGTVDDAQDLVNRFAGTGSWLNDHKERIDFGKVIGQFADMETGEMLDTTVGIIHYSKNGIHIVPCAPSQK